MSDVPGREYEMGDGPPNGLWFRNDCYVDAISCFLGVSYYEAFVLARGGLPPSEDGTDIRADLREVSRNLARIGFAPAKDMLYGTRATPAIVVAAYRARFGCETLHVVVWDGRKRLDSSGADTVLRYGAKIVAVLERDERVPFPRLPLTPVAPEHMIIRAARAAQRVEEARLWQENLARQRMEAHARVRAAFAGARFPDFDSTLLLGA